MTFEEEELEEVLDAERYRSLGSDVREEELREGTRVSMCVPSWTLMSVIYEGVPSWTLMTVPNCEPVIYCRR